MMSRIAAFVPVLFLTACGPASTPPRPAEAVMIPRAEEVRGPAAPRAVADLAPADGGRAARLDRGDRSERGGWDGRAASKTKSEAEGDRAFPSDDVGTALRAARGGLGSCNDSTSARSFDVALRFEPSGRVGEVDVAPSRDDPARSTDDVARCVQRRLSEVSVRSFAGAPVTVRMTVDL